MSINNGAVSIYQDIELSLTEHLVPPVVHVKQFDHLARKVRCTLYANAIEYTIPQNIVLAYSGTRPDGRLFQYSTEAVVNDKIDLIDNRLIITLTDFMTEVSGRYPVDLVMIDADGDILGSFSFTLYVEKAATKNRKILTATYAAVAEAVRLGVFEIFSTVFLGGSVERGLVDLKELTLAGDGTPVQVSARLRRRKVCDCTEKGILHCDCDRYYSQPDCDVGWDSSREYFYNGYDLYILTDAQSQSDLPIFPLLNPASMHDSQSMYLKSCLILLMTPCRTMSIVLKMTLHRS